MWRFSAPDGQSNQPAVCLSCNAIVEKFHFCFGQSEFREATIEADQKIRKGPNRPLRQVAGSREVDVDFAWKSFLVF